MTLTFILTLTWQHLTNFLAFHLKQHIHFPTHDDGHTLDLLITLTSSDIITHLSHHESYQSDTNLLLLSSFHTFVLQLNGLIIQYHSLKTITLTILKLTFSLYTNPASNSSDYLNSLSSTLNSIFDIHAPLKSRTVWEDGVKDEFASNLNFLATPLRWIYIIPKALFLSKMHQNRWRLGRGRRGEGRGGNGREVCDFAPSTSTSWLCHCLLVMKFWFNLICKIIALGSMPFTNYY